MHKSTLLLVLLIKIIKGGKHYMSESRENWGSKIGLILAMAGNAVGLGNFWRFPYQAASNGGGAFMIPYFFALLVIGIPVMLIEWNIGRYGGRFGHGTVGPMVYVQAKKRIAPRKAIILGGLCGAFAFAVSLLVNSYYNHIIGWTLGYGFLSITGGYMNDISTAEIFVKYIQDPSSLVFWIIALLSIGFAVTRGIQKGIEAWAKLMMPVLYVFGIVLAVRALTIGSPVNPDWSSIGGLGYIWNPDFSALNWRAALAAAGQIFFTLSLGMGIICNYASYLKPEDDVVVSSIATISLNEFAEIVLAGTAVIPIAYAFLGQDGVAGGVGLTFMALPNVFRTMGGGQLFGAMWFLLLFFAGFTSAIAMYNYLVAILEEDMGVNRKKASMIVFLGYILVGLPVGLEPILTKTADLAYFTEVDNLVGTYLLIVLGLLETILIGWIVGGSALDEMNQGGLWKIPKWFFKLFHQFLTPVTLIVFLVFSTIDFIKAGYFDLVPSFVANSPQLVPWVNGARAVILSVLVIGFIQAYKSIKSKYSKEIEENKVTTV
jgi:neurotransmitter:Na+ symporter, NSS family